MIKTAPPDALISLMESLADATRLRVLRLMERQELGVAELCDVLQMPQSTVSRHLKLLSDRSWLRYRREGTTNLYRMTLDELDPAARRLWVVAREQSNDWPTVQQDLLRLSRVLEQRQKDSQSFFASAADQWDAIRDELYGRSFLDEAAIALLSEDLVIADLGCGTGGLAADLAPAVKKIIGVDQSAAMLKAARKRTQQLPNVELRKGDLDNLPINDRSCDAALIVLVLTYVNDPVSALRQARRIIKPTGKLVLVDLLHHDRDDFRRRMGQHWPGFDLKQVRSLLSNAGWVPQICRPIPPEPDVKGPALFIATATAK